MKTQITDLTNDFLIEREWFIEPISPVAHFPKISPEDPLAPNKTNYIWANTQGVRDRFGIEDLPANFGPVKKWQYQFAYNGLNADDVAGALLEFLIAPGVVAATVGPLRLDSLGVDTVGQVEFNFSPPLTVAQFNTGSIRNTATDGAAGGVPDVPDFED